jgi:GntR family transcriptional regulator
MKVKVLNIKVEQKSAIPVYEQIKDGVRYNIISGYLQVGDQLMSIREMAARTKIHPNTIIKVYSQLETEGFIESKPGKGYFVIIDKERIGKEKKKLFENTVNLFVSRVTELGYDMDEILNELNKIKNNKDSKKKEDLND